MKISNQGAIRVSGLLPWFFTHITVPVMRILVLRHEKFEGLGHFAEALGLCGIRFSYHDLGADFLPCEYDALVIMGGPMSANDPLPGLAAELSLIEQGLKDGIPMLGICLGSQLLAKALGTRVYRNAELEIGWAPVHLTDAGSADPLFQGIASPTTFFHWHGDTFDLPEGAEWLAYSAKCRHQAFRHGKNVYGLQFHPEVSAEMIADWSTQPVNCGDVATLDAPIDPNAHHQAPVAAQIVKAWVGTF
jgi:GMP synthase (glutamine-hydrolysing)